jgi:hypothetical protein
VQPAHKALNHHTAHRHSSTMVTNKLQFILCLAAAKAAHHSPNCCVLKCCNSGMSPLLMLE